MIAIIDYGVGNLFSLKSSLKQLGLEAVVTADADTIRKADRLILPGVGAFADAMAKLEATGLVPVMKEEAERKPLLGICLGMQLLFERSFEYGEHLGLGLLGGEVAPLKEDLTDPVCKVPHMGWNRLSLSHPADPVWQGMGEDPYFYFVHSYYPVPEDSSLVAASCTYGVRFAAAIRRGNLVATQFHPEKSQKLGVQLLKNFVSL